jgi:hypothetical protein
MCLRPAKSETPAGEPRSLKEVGVLLGIGRARVWFHEKQAIKKLRTSLQLQGITSSDAFAECYVAKGGGAREEVRLPPEKRFSPDNGWLPVDRIRSLNDGSASVEEVVRAFRFLKERNEELVRPPAFARLGRSWRRDYCVQAMDEHRGRLMVRLWPTGKASRAVRDYVRMSCTVVVESVFDSDDLGHFDVPLTLAVALT